MVLRQMAVAGCSPYEASYGIDTVTLGPVAFNHLRQTRIDIGPSCVYHTQFCRVLLATLSQSYCFAS